MDDLRVGAALRAARIRRRLRQCDVAAAAGLSESSVSRMERGHFETLSLRAIRAIAAVLEVRVELLPRSRGADLDRLLNAGHASLAEQVIQWLTGLDGWVVRPEASFSHYGERGVIDVLAWHPGTRSLLVIELKTQIVDVGELLGTFDRKLRNAAHAAASMGWQPLAISGLLVIGESDTNRRIVARHGATFAAALPDRATAVRRWLRAPLGDLRGLVFSSNRHPGQASAPTAGITRIRPGGSRQETPVHARRRA
jgi:transcriptional regulator with XRE-family HTH domain